MINSTHSLISTALAYRCADLRRGDHQRAREPDHHQGQVAAVQINVTVIDGGVLAAA